MSEAVNDDLHSADSMCLEAKEAGWEAAVIVDVDEFEISGKYNDIIYKLYAKRDKETLFVEWRGNSQTSAHYAYGDYHLYPAWRGGVIKLLQGRPDPKKFSDKDKGQHSETTYQEFLTQREVPWANDDVPAIEIMLEVLDKDIRWVSNVHGIVRERREFCPKESNLGSAAFCMRTTQAGKRVLNFANNYGFHACYITDILEVS
jgi:hypothetical protein